MVRRPEGAMVFSKIHFATRLHRDPDSWTNPRTPQRPRDGWTAGAYTRPHFGST